MGDKTFLCAFFLLIGVIVPFLYYTAKVHVYMVEHKPHGYKLPVPKQLWMTGVGVVSFTMMREFLDCVTRPLFKSLIAKVPG